MTILVRNQHIFFIFSQSMESIFVDFGNLCKIGLGVSAGDVKD
jgi:hypothetical protein